MKPRSTTMVLKTKRMVARELAAAIGAEAWEVEVLARMSRILLVRMAKGVIPSFEEFMKVTDLR